MRHADVFLVMIMLTLLYPVLLCGCVQRGNRRLLPLCGAVPAGCLVYRLRHFISSLMKTGGGCHRTIGGAVFSGSLTGMRGLPEKSDSYSTPVFSV